jgi:hypothetical protein
MEKPEKIKSKMSTKVSEVITFIQACHVGRDTDCDLTEAGGVMLVSYPEHLKTTIASRALRPYPEAMVVSDMNVREFSDIREDLLTSRYDTIGFLDYQKVWERDERTSANVEGVIRALTDEGWHGTLGGKTIKGPAARCFMVLCMTPNLYSAKVSQWNKTGFSRRFIALNYVFRDRRVLEAAIKQGHKYQLSLEHAIPKPTNRLLYTVTTSEADYIGEALKDQRGLVGLQLLLRAYNAMKWYYDECRREKDRGMQVLMNIVPLMTENGGFLEVDRPEEKAQRLVVVDESPAKQRRGAKTQQAS